MNAIIICASTHHGNTRKVADAIAKEYNLEVVDATQVHEKDLSEYDLIGFASGIYGGKFDPNIIKFAKENLPENKKIFYIMTSAMNKIFKNAMGNGIDGKNAEIIGRFTCSGYNTFGPFKLVGGTSKGHPDDEDIKNALEFYKGLIKE
jgi:flavodoxin